MPHRRKALMPDAPLAPVPSEILDQFVRQGPISAEELDAAVRRFKKAIIERALGGELTHHLGYPLGGTKPEETTNHRNGRWTYRASWLSPSAFDPARRTSGSSLAQKQRLQHVFFPDGIRFDGKRLIGTGATLPVFNYLNPVSEGEKDLGGPDGSRTRIDRFFQVGDGAQLLGPGTSSAMGWPSSSPALASTGVLRIRPPSWRHHSGHATIPAGMTALRSFHDQSGSGSPRPRAAT